MASPSRLLRPLFALASAPGEIAPASAQPHRELDCVLSESTSSASRSVTPSSSPLPTDPRVRAVEQTAAASVIVVDSAGNFGKNPETGAISYAGTTSPGNAPSAIAVGACDHRASVSRLDDRIADDRLTKGAGSLNVAGASGIATAIDTSVTDAEASGAPTVTRCQSVQSAETTAARMCSNGICGEQFGWARHIVLRDNIVWGYTVYYNLPTWNLLRQTGPDGSLIGNNIVWGDNIVCADGVRWGGGLIRPLDNIVWGDASSGAIT
jgi:hypothetical protein